LSAGGDVYIVQGGLSYLWIFGDGDSSTVENPTHIYITPGVYEVWLFATDSAACNVRDSSKKIITIYDQPVAVVSADTSSCNGTPVPLLAGGGQYYSWVPTTGLFPPNIATPTATPTVTTTYTVYVSNDGGCIDSAEVTVTVTSFLADAGLTASFCEGSGGASVQGTALGGTPGYYYHWWCDSITGGNCGIGDQWDDNPTVNPTISNTYYVQITDTNGCMSLVDSVIVDVLPLPIVDAGPDRYICPPGTPGAFLDGSVVNAADVPGPYEYHWTPGAGLNDSTIFDPYARPDTTTIYTLVITSTVTGCTSIPTTLDTLSTAIVHVNPNPIVDAGPDIDLCFGSTIELPGVAWGAGPTYTYEWSPTTGLADPTTGLPNPFIPNPDATSPATTEYVFSAWSNGCMGSDTVIVNVHTIPTPAGGNTQEICLGDSARIGSIADGDSTVIDYTFIWWPTDGLNDPGLANPTASPDTSTWYSVIAISSHGCESPMDNVLLYVKPTPLPLAGDDTELCEGDSLLLHGSYHYDGTEPAPDSSQVTFGWSISEGPPFTTDTLVWVSPSQTTVYTLTAHYNTCTKTDSVVVWVTKSLNSGAAIDTNTICQYDSVQLFGWGGQENTKFAWSPADGLSDASISSPFAAPDDSLTYMFEVWEGGCRDTHFVQLNVIPRPVVDLYTSMTEGCADFTVSFLETSDETYSVLWDFGDNSPISNLPNPSHTYTQAGTYNVILHAKGLGNCTTVLDTTWVIVYDSAKADFTTSPTIPMILYLPNTYVEFLDGSINANQWEWEFGDSAFSHETNPAHLYTETGTYHPILRVTTPNGCGSSVQKGPIEVKYPDLDVPNVFTPNGDGENDQYLIEYSGQQPFHFEVFDRWGTRHFDSDNKNTGWDGNTTSGNQAAEGVYYYILNIGSSKRSGYLTLLR